MSVFEKEELAATRDIDFGPNTNIKLLKKPKVESKAIESK
jgi:hypothetical protein